MKSKTLALIAHYSGLLVEQDQTDPNAQVDPSQEQAPPDVQDVTAPQPTDEMPLTSEGEDEYIENLIDAALFEPSSEDAKTLMNLQSAMQLKRYTNAREEILPTVLSIINPSSESKDIRKELNKIP